MYGDVPRYTHNDGVEMVGESEVQSPWRRVVIEETSGAVSTILEYVSGQHEAAAAAASAIGDIQSGITMQQQQLHDAVAKVGEAHAIAPRTQEQMLQLEQSHAARTAEQQAALAHQVEDRLRTVAGGVSANIEAIQRKASEDVNRIEDNITHVTSTVSEEISSMKAELQRLKLSEESAAQRLNYLNDTVIDATKKLHELQHTTELQVREVTDEVKISEGLTRTLQRRVDEIVLNCQALRAQLKERDTEVEGLRSAHQQAWQEIRELQKEHRDYQQYILKRLDDNRDAMDDLREGMKSEKDFVSDLSNQIDVLRSSQHEEQQDEHPMSDIRYSNVTPAPEANTITTTCPHNYRNGEDEISLTGGVPEQTNTPPSWSGRPFEGLGDGYGVGLGGFGLGSGGNGGYGSGPSGSGSNPRTPVGGNHTPPMSQTGNVSRVGPVFQLKPKEPPIFRGNVEQDVDRWLYSVYGFFRVIGVIVWHYRI